ncbi:MAG: LLM class F420-dependent oxidoreductase [Dehalococcoidia bacterium]|nr:LLM class F420-dependent oxidoreductase [Dehalococcoidia bacterium]
MKLAVEFPSIVYREGRAGVVALAQAIERIGFDQIDVFDHVVMGHPIEGRASGPYPANMPIMEALAMLAFITAVTERVGLGTEVLVLPQRQPVLVAKQVSTIDSLSGGRVRLGIGVGWQESEFDALGADFHSRGRAMDEAIALMRACWSDPSISADGEHYPVEEMAMEPKPPAEAGLPIWIGGGSPAALKRTGTLGDGWLAGGGVSAGAEAIATIKRHAEQAGRDPDALGFQSWLAPIPGGDDPNVSARAFIQDPDAIAASAAAAAEAGFDWATINITAIFQNGARSSEQMAEVLETIHERLRREVGFE